MPINERIAKLKSRTVSKACHGGSFLAGVKPDVERACLWTESYKMTEGEPEVIRRAKALAHVLEKMTVYIQEDELIVGNNTPSPAHLYLSPEINLGPLEEVIAEKQLSEEDSAKLDDVIKYWRGKTEREAIEARMTKEEIEINAAGAPVISVQHLDGAQHCAPDWEYLYENGVDEIRKKIEAKLALVGAGGHADLLKAMLIALNGLVVWAERYSRLAAEQAKAPGLSEQRRTELTTIAETCGRALKKPPATFQEALQDFFFVHLAMQYIDRAGFGSLCRIDQIWLPFYRKSIGSGMMTQIQGQELLEALWVKMLDLEARRLHFDGNSLLQTLTIGGVDCAGNDACNELTELVLESVKSCHNNQPTFNFRYHPGCSQTALTKAIEVVKTGIGMPAFLNDTVMIHTLVDQGVPLELARNWAVVGCVSACPTTCQITTKRLAQSSIVAKCLELAFNDGRCLFTGKQLGPRTGDARSFTIDQLFEALRTQVRFAFELGIRIKNYGREWEKEHLQRPLASALHRTPIERGQDASSYEDYPNNWMNIVGVVDIIDSFAAIQKVVFEDRACSMADIVDAVRANWEGQEALRQRCINRAPKFGNDDDSVDILASKIFEMIALECRQVKDVFNKGGYRILPQSVSMYTSCGKKVFALPNGRKAADFLADGGASPQHGLDRNGATAVLKSVSKLAHRLTKGVLLNQRFMPEAIEGPEGMERFKAYLRTWFDLGISQIQFNVVSNKTLVEAQQHPENYGDLVVRVAGYSAFFTQLSKPVQDAIIQRREQKL